jgi:hypothetical protein
VRVSAGDADVEEFRYVPRPGGEGGKLGAGIHVCLSFFEAKQVPGNVDVKK